MGGLQSCCDQVAKLKAWLYDIQSKIRFFDAKLCFALLTPFSCINVEPKLREKTKTKLGANTLNNMSIFYAY